MKSIYRFFYVYLLLGAVLLAKPEHAFPYITAAGETPATSLSVHCGASLLLPGVPCELTLQASDLPDIQYAGLELRYDTARLTFLQERPGPVFDGNAVTIARHLPNGRLGVSVSSTAGEIQADGDILYMDFVIRDGAPAGTASFSVEVLEFTDSDGSPLPAPLPETTGIDVPPYLSDAGITGPGPVTIARGSELQFSFRLAASGVTADDLSDPERFTAEMAIIDATAWDGSAPFPDPASFDRTVPLSYTGTSGGQFRFEAPFPPEQPVGSWLVTGRFRLDDQPVLIAGYGSDGGGVWDPETFTAVEVTVTTPRVTVAGWTFDGEQWTADTGLFTNMQAGNQAEVSLTGARFSGWTTGSSGRAPNSNNWQQEDNGDNGDNGNNGDGDNGSDGGGDENGNGDGDSNSENESEIGNSDNGSPVVHDKYWQARLSTGGYHELTLQFRMNGSGTGPRDFRLYYSLDGGTSDGLAGWQPVPDGDFQAGTSWTLFTMNLPADAADAPELLLRWVRIGNTSIAGNDIGPTGTNRLDEVRITGVPLDTEEMFVWPGSTTGEGTVTEADVLNLALYWMSTGPERIPRRINWAPQPVVRWVPETAAHADTDGDGRVGYRDLLAIGRNFGQDVEPVPQKIASSTILSKTLPVLSAQETVRVVLQAGPPVPLLGISARFSLDQLPPDAWELVEFAPGNWAADWQAHDRLIRFHHGRTPETVRKAVPQDDNAQGRHDKTASASYGSQNGGLSDTQDNEQSDAQNNERSDTQNNRRSDAQNNEWTDAQNDQWSDTQNSSWSAAWAHTGAAAPVPATELVTLIIRARTDWDAAPVLHLHRASLSAPEGLDLQPDTESWELIRQDRPVDAEPGHDPSREIPLTTRLHANYPNPFNPSTILSFDLHESGQVRVSIYDALGRRIAILTDTRMDAGRHELTWDAARLASGMYLVRLETRHTTQTRQVMLLK
ncbi:MAG: T9SS C-terminal target domain-containing protein [Balneolaceae bacterium]|nr:MAG: T9SS C-terminal target domain-containing protein [Balneolaceae bacterium]